MLPGMSEETYKAVSGNSHWYLILGDSWSYMPLILVSSSAKRIATQILVPKKLHERYDLVLTSCVFETWVFSKPLPVQY